MCLNFFIYSPQILITGLNSSLEIGRENVLFFPHAKSWYKLV